MHSSELRERALKAYDSGKWSYEEVAEMFGVSVASLVRWRALRQATGSAKSTLRRGGNPARVRAEDEAVVQEIVASNNDFTIEEITVAFVARTERECSRSAMARALAKLRLTRKKSR